MELVCQASGLRGVVEIPGSKSHTIRAVAVGSLARGESVITAPLESADTMAAVEAYRALGAKIRCEGETWRIEGFGGEAGVPENVIDVKNSGTTLRIAVGSAALMGRGVAVFTGDHQIRRRPIGPLMQSLNDLGAHVVSTRGNGCAPLVVEGKLRGGRTSIQAVTSQYLTSLLMACPLAEGESVIDVPVLNEAPYINVTLGWLERAGVEVEYKDFRRFVVKGGQRYRAVEVRVPADFSSATFFLAAGAMGGNRVEVRGLDMNDAQGDKAVVEYLKRMGAEVTVEDGGIVVEGGELRGCEIDMNATPDALPMMAVLGCFAKGETRLVNVPQARMKETDRIAVMAGELKKMGADIEELEAGLVVRESKLRGAAVEGHDDHRVVMSLAVAASGAAGETRISTAEAMAVTFPTFVEKMAGIGGKLVVKS